MPRMSPQQERYDQYRQLESVYQRTGQANADQWQAGREGYYSDLQGAYAGAAGQQADVYQTDSNRSNAFQQAARGTRGGSADTDAQGRINANVGVIKQRGVLAGKTQVAQARLADEQRLQQYLGGLYGGTMGSEAVLAGLTRTHGVDPGTQAALWRQGAAQDASSQASWSQIYGQQLSNVGRGIDAYGSSL